MPARPARLPPCDPRPPALAWRAGITAALLMLMAVPSALAQAQAQVAGDKVITGCGHHAYPPWNWERQGQIVGSCAEVATAAFAAAGLRLKLDSVGPWARCQRLVEQGAVDVNICALDNARRREHSQFVETPMGHNEISVFVRRDSDLKFERWSDLIGKRIGVVNGVSLGSDFDTYLRQFAKLDSASSETNNMQKLVRGRTDAVVTGRELGLLEINALNCQRQLTALPEPVLTGNLYIQMSRQSRHLDALPKVQAFLTRPEYKNWLQTLQQKYTALYNAEHRSADMACISSP